MPKANETVLGMWIDCNDSSNKCSMNPNFKLFVSVKGYVYGVSDFEFMFSDANTNHQIMNIQITKGHLS